MRDPARDVDGSVRVDGRRQAACASRPASASSTRVNKPRGRRLDRASDPQGRPTVVSLVAERAAAVPGRPPRRRHHRADPADQRRRARAPAHPPVVRGPAHLPRQGAPRAGREPALRALREGVELDDGLTAPARVAAARARPPRDHDPRGPQAPGAADVEAVGHPVHRARARRASGRCGSASSRPGEHRRADRGGDRAAARGADRRSRAPMRLVALRGATTVDGNDAEAILARHRGADARDARAQRARRRATS